MGSVVLGVVVRRKASDIHNQLFSKTVLQCPEKYQMTSPPQNARPLAGR